MCPGCRQVVKHGHTGHMYTATVRMTPDDWEWVSNLWHPVILVFSFHFDINEKLVSSQVVSESPGTWLQCNTSRVLRNTWYLPAELKYFVVANFNTVHNNLKSFNHFMNIWLCNCTLFHEVNSDFYCIIINSNPIYW